MDSPGDARESAGRDGGGSRGDLQSSLVIHEITRNRTKGKVMADLILKDEVYAVMGAAMEVYKVLGNGFLEQVYQEALEIELAERGIAFDPQKPLRVQYKGQILKKEYVADFVCFGQIIVELKALDKLTTKEESQLLNYLKITGFRVGLLVNFGQPGGIEWKRFVH
jgi:GxxExxY protein